MIRAVSASTRWGNWLSSCSARERLVSSSRNSASIDPRRPGSTPFPAGDAIAMTPLAERTTRNMTPGKPLKFVRILAGSFLK